LYGCETWSFTLSEEHRLRLLENRVLRKISGSKRDEVTGSGKDYITRSFIICSPQQILFGDHIKNEMGGACGMYGGEERCAQGFGGEA
jgi:hypothetical protein